MKQVAPHISHVHCVIQRQHLAARHLCGDMEKALNAAVSVINFNNSFAHACIAKKNVRVVGGRKTVIICHNQS